MGRSNWKSDKITFVLKVSSIHIINLPICGKKNYCKFNLLFVLNYFRAAILAVTAYLEAFQKIADAATNARGKYLIYS